jgi:transposase-like protein
MANPVLSHPRFHDEEAAYEWIEAIVWEDGRVCPHCGVIENSGKLKGKTTRIGLYKCYACRKPFTVKIGTIFEDSHAPLNIWLQAMYLLCSSKKGMSTNQLRRTLGVHMKTAWHMSHRIRLAMDGSSGRGPIGGAGKIVESDETFITKSPKTRRAPGERSDVQVLSLVERGGPIRSVFLDHTNVRPALYRHLDFNSRLYTDGAMHYVKLMPAGQHESVDHSKGEYVRGDVHTNTLEGFFSIFKRGMVGVYQHCNEAHLHRYLAEFDFRYNNRVARGVSDEERTDCAIRGIIGKRLTYRETVDATKAKTAQ